MKNKKTGIVFRSRLSVLLLVIILAAFIPAIIPIVKHKIVPGLIIIGVTFLFTIFILTGVRYIISGDKLYVKIWNIPSGSVDIMNITSATRSYNPLSSPASSLKRLRLGLGGRVKNSYMLISPVRESMFIEELEKVNPNITVDIPVKKGMWRIQDWDL